MKKLLCFLFAAFLAACAQPDLTDKQSAYDVMAKFRVVQIAVEKAVTSPDIPADVKKYLQLAEETSRTAVLAYADAVRVGGGEAANILPEAVDAVASLAGYLIANGWLTEDGWKGASLWTPQPLYLSPA